MFRFLYYLQNNFILLKTIKKYNIVFFLLSLLSLKIFNVFFNSSQLDILYSAILWIFFSYFFIKLKQQNFFKQLLFTRACFHFEFEILFFATTWFIMIFLIEIPIIPFYSVETNIQNILSMFFTILDALFFATSKIAIYISMQIVFLLFDALTNIDYIKFALYNNVPITEILQMDNKLSILFFIKITLEVFYIKKAIINSVK